MTILHSILFGIVEGISEFLPISSTGHLILFSHILALAQTDFLKSFEIAIQLGAIASVVVLYWRSFLLNVAVMKRIVVAFIPTGIVGLVLYKIIKTYLLGNETIVVWALILGGIFLIVFELLHKERDDAAANVEDISYKQAFGIGLAQSVAIIPGVSRSAATILGGLGMRIKRATIVEFSFLLAAPIMLVATAYDLYKTPAVFVGSNFTTLIVGFVVSFFVAYGSIRFLLRFIKTHTFIPFGVYRIVIGLLFLLLIVL